jgi:hypothetical protein
MLDSFLEHSFPEGRTVTTKGKVVWDGSWCGKNIKALTKGSSNALCKAQYHPAYAVPGPRARRESAVSRLALTPHGSDMLLDSYVVADPADSRARTCLSPAQHL